MKKVGDSIRLRPNVEAEKPLEGQIVHINQKHRHFTVRFPGGWCESFKLEDMP